MKGCARTSPLPTSAVRYRTRSRHDEPTRAIPARRRARSRGLHREGPRIPNPDCCGGSAVSRSTALSAFIIGSIVEVALYRFLPPAGTPLMLIRRVEGYGIDKSWRPLDQISPHLIRAVMAGED